MTKQVKKRGKSTIQKIPKYKMDVLKRVLESDVLTKYMYYEDRDALFKDSLSMEDRNNLLYQRLFPYRFVPSPIENQSTYITLGVNGFRRHEEGFKVFDDYQSGEIYFYLFTHTDLMQTDNGVRQDVMLAEIDRLFDSCTGLGMGELKLRYVNELWMHNNKFGGYTVSFTITDLK
ncbi:hypothetical protein RVS70_05655 [Virgibacillus sp. M23]|uniref:hypothetical protein n=1 Tax=Virgibacillus sp. M23 TaxID=3079030 RepID=UPI002A90A2E5|nr:hypothetical protein [Virgibacillus sp. M23]MDY7043686.1 hypothetical protein [Virgibacillus sp. M23]